MPDLRPLLEVLAFAYGAAAVGLAAALVTRAWLRARGRAPSAMEAAWCALLPLLAVLGLPLISGLEPHAAAPLSRLHHLWHQWERAIHSEPATHRALHAGNGLLLIFAAFSLARTSYTLASMRAFALALRAAAHCSARFYEGVPCYLVPSPRPVCFTLGVLKPEIYLSTGLQEQLSPRDREAVLAHELAHVRRHDGLMGALLAVFYTLFALPGGRMLRADWERAAERACDAEAARRLGSPCDVAAALVRVARCVSQSRQPVPGVACFAAFNEEIEGRVQALLSIAPTGESAGNSPLIPRAAFLLASVMLISATGFWVRHAVELFVHH